MSQTEEQQLFIEKGCLERVENHCFRDVNCGSNLYTTNYSKYIFSITIPCIIIGFILIIVSTSSSEAFLYIGVPMMILGLAAIPFCTRLFMCLEKARLEGQEIDI